MDDRSVLGRALTILDAALEHSGPVSLADLTRETGLPKPTVRRIANDLVARSLLASTPHGYTSGAGLIAAGARAAEQQAIQQRAKPFLQELYAQTHAVVWLLDARSERRWTIVDSVVDRRAAAFSNDWPRDPTHASILATAVGRLALCDQEERVDALLRVGVPRLTSFTRTSAPLIWAEVKQAAETGAVVEHEQVRRGWSCLAVPVAPGMFLGVVETSARFDDGRLLALARRTATQLAASGAGGVATG